MRRSFTLPPWLWARLSGLAADAGCTETEALARLVAAAELLPPALVAPCDSGWYLVMEGVDANRKAPGSHDVAPGRTETGMSGPFDVRPQNRATEVK